MIDKCANPRCEQQLIYLRSGQLYAVERRRTGQEMQMATSFFWLCAACSRQYRLDFNGRGDPDFVPVNAPYPAYGLETERRVRCIWIRQPVREAAESIGLEEGKANIPPSPPARERREACGFPPDRRLEERTCA